MDKKAKKKIDILNKKLQTMRQQIAGARKQDDEPGEIDRLESEIASAEAVIAKLKQS